MDSSFWDHFAVLPDPRVERTRRHSLQDILTIAICSVIGGADSWVDMAMFGRSKKKWFQTFLDLPSGIPSHDTFGRVFAALEPSAFESCFQSWVSDLAGSTEGKLIAIDGKTIRRSMDTASGKSAIHLVSAWVHENHAVFGQVAVEAKSNEITAIPKLLKMLQLKDATVTIDAMGTQKEIAQTIIQGGGNYLLALKGINRVCTTMCDCILKTPWRRIFEIFRMICGNWSRRIMDGLKRVAVGRLRLSAG
jgi:hypothetical protein